MTAANEKPDCPCCKSSRTNKFEHADMSGRDCGCRECGCIWDESKRRAQAAEAVFTADELNLFRQWFNAITDTNPKYLGEADKQLNARVLAMLARARGGN